VPLLFTLTEIQFSRQLLGKPRKMFQENPFICCMGKDRLDYEQEETDSAELIAGLRNFANSSLVPYWSSVTEGTDNKQDKYQS
jgi:hypothetical protein